MLIVFFFLCPPHHLVGYLGIYNFSNLDLMFYLLSILLFFLDLQVGFCQLEHLVLCFLCILLHFYLLLSKIYHQHIVDLLDILFDFCLSLLFYLVLYSYDHVLCLF